MLARDPAYAARAKRVTALTKDLAETAVAGDALKTMLCSGVARKGRSHSPCSLQHGLKVKGRGRGAADGTGASVAPVGESHLCCGSAGTYSVLQPELSIQLRDRRLGHLQAPRPDAILSANIGCITHLQSGTETRVMHWIEWLDERLNPR